MSAKQLKELALSDTGFVFDPYTGATFTVNATGLATLQALRDGLDRSGVIERLRERFLIGAGAADLSRDLDEFVGLLKQNGMVGADFAL